MAKALISVYDKTGLVDFAQELVGLGYQILSTGGTFKLLQENGIEVTKVSEITQFPEILGGRVKTLHPKIHGGILAKRNEEHLQELKKHAIDPIDLVIVNLYPFKETVSKPGVTLEEALENIDIGGPTMIRAAAKNFPNVLVIVNPLNYNRTIEALKKGKVDMNFRKQLASEAFSHTANYDALITGYLKGNEAVDLSDECFIDGTAGIPLRYGENPHQNAYVFKIKNKGIGLADINPIQGKQLSYNNYLDTYAAWQLVQEFDEPASVIIKHNNPCGAAVDANMKTAYLKALECDPVSAFGGIVAFNKTVEADLASELAKNFYEVIAAPAFSAESLEIFGTKPNLRILPLAAIAEGDVEVRTLGNSLIIQEQDRKIDKYELNTVTEKKPTDKQIRDLIFANRVVKWVKSNAIVVVKDGATLGIGAGQMNRVGSAKIALEQAGDKTQGAILASDAFLPFADTVEIAAKHKISAIIQPGGSVKDEEVIKKCNELGIVMIFTGVRHFKH